MPTTVSMCLIMYILILCHSGAVVTSHWTYDDQDKWPTLCKEGKKQSPISLARDEAKEEKFEPFIFDKYNKRYAVESKNNGHTVEFRISNASDNLPTVKGGGLSDAYKVDNLHFHWSSEHVVDNYRFPLELHIVHYAIKYKNITTALNHPGGVAVFAVLFDLSPDDDETFEPLVDVVDKLQQKGNVIQHPSLIIENYLPRDTAGYFRYEGSLTTPGCTEGVIWTVFTNTLPVSKEQMQSFLKLKTDNHNIRTNYRSLQDVNSRKIHLKVSPIRDPSGSAIRRKLFSLLLFINVLNFILL